MLCLEECHIKNRYLGKYNMPKLLQINSCLDKSTGRIAQQIGEKAILSGYESYIAYSSRAGRRDSKSIILEIGTRSESIIHAIMTRIFDNHGLCSKCATQRLISQIKELKPDIIHLHNIHGYYINYKILFEYLADSGIPVVWTLHDCWPFTGHCVHFTDVNCNKWTTGTCDDCPKKKSYPASILFDRSQKNYLDKKHAFTSLKNLTIVPVSYWLGEMTKHSFLKDFPLRVIQNGIDIQKFRRRTDVRETIRRRYGWHDKFVVLGVATGWSEDVGLSTFYKLNSSLSADYVIAMVGLTDEQLMTLPKGITGIKRTNSQEELAEIYTAADILFNGSYQETFGLVTAEAMACGTPVIVYNSTACPEIVDETRGRVIPVGDFTQLIDSIRDFKDMSVIEKESITKACIDYVRNNLDKDHKYQDYIDLYNMLLKRV